MSKAKWYFPNNGGGLAAGFNDSGIDTFKGHRLSSLVREIVQNSLDAGLMKTEPVTVAFNIVSLDKKDVPEVSQLEEHLVLAKATAKKQNLDPAVDFYDRAIGLIKDEAKINFLCIHDSNTTGLTGPIAGPNGAWFALTKGAGLSQKTSASSLGSFGHGSKAPFANSNVRSLFYLTKIEQNNKKEFRFQGKSILQSYSRSEYEMTQGTGFYGIQEGCRPLDSADIPQWAIDIREKFSNATGTSIYVPHTIFELSSYPSIVITAIANFFYAIRKGSLIVKIGENEELNSQNIEEKYHYYKDRLDQEFNEVDKDYLIECFQAIETVVNSTHKGEQQIPNFGRIDWYIRMNEEVETRSVAIARENGMLITRAAPSLQRFPNLKHFDLFVCVTGEGSETLKTIENPEHNNFAFDRIDNLQKRKSAKKKYDAFAKAVRELLSRFAEYSSSDRVTVDELQDLFSEISENPDEGKGALERGPQIQIANGNYSFKPKPTPSDKPKPGDGPPDELGGRGARGGEKKQKRKGGGIPDPKGGKPIIGPSAPTHGGLPKNFLKLENLRMRATGKNQAYVYFDSPLTGLASIRFKKSGEIGSEPISLIVNDKPATAVDVELVSGQREYVLVTFADKTVDFAIEAEAHEINN
jgi:hypothetical protein